MQTRERVFFVTVVLACLVGFLGMNMQQSDLPPVKPDGDVFASGEALPDFGEFEQVQAKKDAFFGFMLPLVKQENRRIAELRQKLIELSGQLGQLSGSQRAWLQSLAEQYRVAVDEEQEEVAPSDWPIDTLLLRVDQVPPSLALAQAANESAWGTSRFAEKGNNLFGQWCFKKGCGLVPNSRVEGAIHEVASFDSPKESVERYILNLNTNMAYKEFRQWRARQREQNQPLTGLEAATTLTRYSERGEAYIDELQSMIRYNELSQYDNT